MAKLSAQPIRLESIALSLVSVDAADQMAADYCAYAAHVNLGRAIPSVIDGLKPVQRRILYAMSDLGLTPDKPFRKCARVAGEVMGRLHASGDSYGALVNMANDWANRYALIDGHGNFGTTSDGAAAARYTECRLKRVAQALLLEHTDAAWVAYKPTYDSAWSEPVTMAARLPVLLLRDTAGIGVAAACRHVSYNLRQVASLCKAALRSELKPSDALAHVTQPDFAMGAQVLHSDGMRSAIVTGVGSFHLRAVLEIDGATVIATQLPQDVSPERVLEQTYELIKSEVISRRTLLDARDETDRSGTRVVWELRNAADVPTFVRLLWRRTDCQISVSVNAVSVDADFAGYKLRGVSEVANEWAKHRKAYERSRLVYELGKYAQRSEVLDGLLLALKHIKVVAQALIDGISLSTLYVDCKPLSLTHAQVDAIEAMPLRTLRAKNANKLRQELAECAKELAWRTKVTASDKALVAHIARDVDKLAAEYGDDFRTTEYISTELDVAAVEITALAPSKARYLLDNRLEGKEHTYYVSSSPKLKKLQPVELRDTLGIAVLMDNGNLYWLPASTMPVDERRTTPARELLRQYLPTTKRFEPSARVVWSERLDSAHCDKSIWLLGSTAGKDNCVAKRLDLADALNWFGTRRKAVWTGMIAQSVLSELPADGCVTADFSDKMLSVDLRKLPKISVTAHGRLISRNKANSYSPGNTTDKKRPAIVLM